MLGWLAFAIHACVLGMCTLFSQIYTLILLVGSTVIFVQRFSWDLFAGEILDHSSAATSMTVTRRRDFNNSLQIVQEEIPRVSSKGRNFDKEMGLDRRMNAYARAQLTPQQEEQLRHWNFMPYSAPPYYKLYQELKEEMNREIVARGNGFLERPIPAMLR